MMLGGFGRTCVLASALTAIAGCGEPSPSTTGSGSATGGAGGAAVGGSAGSMAGNAGVGATGGGAGGGGAVGGSAGNGVGGAGTGGTTPGDGDGDGLSDADEMQLGTDPDTADSDDDGLDDALEVQGLANPLDTDADGLIDALESYLTDNNLDGVTDYQDPSPDWQVTSGRFRPAVIANDGVSSTTLEVRMGKTQDLTRVAIFSNAAAGANRVPDELLIDGVALGNTDLELFDDGTHGDRYAGDGVYSRGNITTTMAIRSGSGVRDHLLFHTLRVEGPAGIEERQLGNPDELGRQLQFDLGYWLGVVDQSALVTPVMLPDGVQKAPHVINFADRELWLNSKLTLFAARQAVMLPRHLQAARVLELIEGDVDFVGFFTDHRVPSSAAAVYLQASNSIQGIGLDVYVAAPEWNAETDQFKGAIGINAALEFPINHELMHNWGVFLSPDLGFNPADGHWGVAGTYGVLGGFDEDTLVDNGDGTFTMASFSGAGNDWLTTPLSNAELYLMGLAGPESVPPFTVISDASLVEETFDFITVAGSATTVTIDDVIVAHGERVPDVASAQTDFTAAFAVCSEYPLTVAELSWFNAAADFVGRPELAWDMSFPEATGGRATLTTLLPPLVGE